MSDVTTFFRVPIRNLCPKFVKLAIFVQTNKIKKLFLTEHFPNDIKELWLNVIAVNHFCS